MVRDLVLMVREAPPPRAISYSEDRLAMLASLNLPYAVSLCHDDFQSY